tara:strand:+ start:1074 stop:1961 length:888 start_codon:yes stop_codon:yes gene_type:complete
MKINSNYFKKKNIIITGANQGLGLEMAKHFYKLGANIIICARNNEKLKNVKKILKKNKAQIIIIEKCDVSKFKQVDLFFDRIIKKIKKIDILINNAGIYGPKGEIEDLSWKDFKKTFEINLFGSIYLIKKVIPHFKKYNKGKIVQMSGGGAASPLPYFSAYATSKAGIVRFIENISKELESYKIDINAVAPGPINTRMLDEVLSENPETVGRAFYNKSVIQKKNGGTDIKKILDCVEFLCHKKSNGISGKLVSVLWDNWKKFYNYKKILRNTDLGNMRRITGRERKIKFFDKNEK